MPTPPASKDPKPHLREGLFTRVRHFLLGPARNLKDPLLSQQISLAAFMAWIGLGADGLSSSAYGPDEAFRALGGAIYLAPFLVIAMAGTVLIISYTYSKIIEHFPEGGGGYLVATKLLGNSAGVVSGSALLVDYILTITVSIAAGADAVFSLLPVEWHYFKLPLAFGAIVFLFLMNLRGVKESVAWLVPVFLTFIVTHIVVIVGIALGYWHDFAPLTQETVQGLHHGAAQIGVGGLFILFLRAYSMGGGTYTGIEAVSNGLSILREPKVVTGKKTMTYMAFSLAFTAGGLLLCYLLLRVSPMPGQTMNAVLLQKFAGEFVLLGIPVGHWFVWLTVFSEAVLLLVAAQTGFIGGPRIMANMATDSWLPKRFATLSDRLTTQRGIILISVAALVILAYTRGNVRMLVIMYSINVFVTFSLSQLGMCRFWLVGHRGQRGWVRNLFLHVVGFLLCGSILVVMLLEKMGEGGWMTILFTGLLIGLCFAIKRHYTGVAVMVKKASDELDDVPAWPEVASPRPVDPEQLTAVILVGGGYSRTAVHTFFNVLRYFPNTFKNFVFVSIGAINSDFFKDEKGVEELEHRTRDGLSYYLNLAKDMGFPVEGHIRVGTDVVNEASELCVEISQRFPQSVFFASELVFQETHWYQPLLHNETAYAIQRRLRSAGLAVVILPILLYNQKQELRASREAIYRGVPSDVKKREPL